MRAVNLLPRDEGRRSAGKPSMQSQLMLAAPFVAGGLLAVGTMLSGAKLNDRKAELQALQAQLKALPAPAAPQKSNVDPRLAAENSQRVSALAAALSQRVAWDRVLREVSSVLPDDVWLTSLGVQSAGVAAATQTSGPPASGLTIQGYTYSQAGVARLLSRIAIVPEIGAASLKSSTQTKIGGRLVVQFEIDATVQPGANG